MYDLYASGASMREVAQAFGVSEVRVSQIFKGAGLMVPPPDVAGRPRTYRFPDQAERDARVAAMKRLYDGGATLAQVGEAFGCTGENVLYLFERTGIS